MFIKKTILFFLILFLFSSCSKKENLIFGNFERDFSTTTDNDNLTQDPNGNTVISWTKNAETIVNQKDGGYRLFIGKTQDFSTYDDGVYIITLPFSGETRDPQVKVNLPSGNYFAKIIAFGNFEGNSLSDFSDPIQITVK